LPLPQGLSLLHERSGVQLAFSPSLLPETREVTCLCEDVTVGEALDRILAGTPFHYVEIGGHVVIERATPPPLPRIHLAMTLTDAGEDPAFARTGTRLRQVRTAVPPRQGTITGRVTDGRTGAPITNASVFVATTGFGASTDRDGRFVIANVPSGEHVVRVQMLGYGVRQQSVTVEDGRTVTVDFTLDLEAVALDELVVTAVGEQRAREIGTSLTRITAREIEASPARNTQDILTARTPGATILQNTGQPGAGGLILLRGNNSISQGNSPVVYIDGIRIYGGSTPLHPQARQSSSPLNDISAENIERVEVIKGAAATTLYGTEASGGVIQIFTKRGQSGAPQWSAEISGGINRMGRIGSDADPTGMWVKQCRGPNNVASDGRIFEDVTCPSSGSWLQTGPVQRYALSVSGGSDIVNYYLSGNYSDEQGVIHDAGGSGGGGFLANFAFRPSPAIELSLNSSFSRRDTDWIPSGDNGDGFMLNVSRGFGSNFTGAPGCTNPDAICVRNGALFTQDNTSRTSHFITGFTAKHQYGENLSNRLTVGYDFNTSAIENVRPFGYPRFPQGDMTVRSWQRTLLTIDYVGSILHAFRGGSVSSSLSWGGQLFADDSRTVNVNAFEFSGPGKPTLTSAARRDVTQDDRERVTNAGFFLQETLALKDRLFVTGGIRVDGNSAFGSDFGLQFYPKISASYVISDESFWPVNWWPAMKLRAALGESGKAPGAFDAVRTWNPIAGDNGQPGFTPGQLGNANLGPERSREYELGFEAALLQGRVGLDFTYFNARTFDALIPVRKPPSEGFLNTQLENVGEILNTGIELRVSFDVLRRPGFDWRARVDYSTVESEAIDLAGQVITVQTFGRTYIREGFPVPGIFGMRITNPDEFANPVYEEDAYIGPIYPTKTIGLNTNLTLRENLVLDALGEFKFGGHMINGNAYQNGRRGAWFPCYAIQAKDRASRGPDPSAMDDVTALQRARCALDGSAVAPSYDAWIESTDFFKLRSVSLTYQLPERLIPGTRSASLQVAGRNLWTSTDYTGSDPELDDYRTSLARRDYYVLPTYRTFVASLKVNF
jgi:TonB-linked SusC/RagA family outer membrane protein